MQPIITFMPNASARLRIFHTGALHQLDIDPEKTFKAVEVAQALYRFVGEDRQRALFR